MAVSMTGPRAVNEAQSYRVGFIVVENVDGAMRSLVVLAGADPEGWRRGRTPTCFCAKFFEKSPKLA